MQNNSIHSVSTISHTGSAKRSDRNRLLLVLMAAAAITAATPRQSAVAAPAAGETFVYRIINAYSNETHGQVSYRVDKVDADRVVMSVTTDTPGVQLTSTEIYTPDGNWLRHPLINHDRPVDYDFAPAYPSYEFPLEPGKQWSTRVNAMNPATGKSNSVRVDAKVMGTERIRVPAGEFDTIKIRRSVYAGDTDFQMRETTISELDWYAPALGRSVRRTSNSVYRDLSYGKRNQVVLGDWNVYELVSAPVAR